MSPTNPTADALALIAPDMAEMDRVIGLRLHTGVPLVGEVSRYIISAGGKRLRPVLVLLMARALGYEGTNHHLLAAVVEFIHTATLLHDDVVDESSLRRGRPTANASFGNAASVLVGDFVYSRAFQMMVEVGSMRVMDVLAEATNVIAEGEVLQLMNCHDPDIDEQRYLHALNFCMLLPGPEATQLATYVGWRLHGIKGGLAAGILFVLPGALMMLGGKDSFADGGYRRTPIEKMLPVLLYPEGTGKDMLHSADEVNAVPTAEGRLAGSGPRRGRPRGGRRG